MTEIIPYRSQYSLEPSFRAVEFSMPDVEIEHLASGMGRYAIFNSLIDHQQQEGLIPENQVWAGINAVSLVARRTLFSELNPLADPVRFSKNFNATQLDHWRSVLGEVKYSPFTYIYKGILGRYNDYPALVGFDRSRLIPVHGDGENIDWKPASGETVESSLQSVYYLNGFFPKVESSPEGGFNIPAHLVPENPESLLGMIDFVNETNTGYTYRKTREAWAEAGYPKTVMSILESWAQTFNDYLVDNPTESSLDFKSLRAWKDDTEELFKYNEKQLVEMIDLFNKNFFGINRHEFRIEKSNEGALATIIGQKIESSTKNN